MKSESKIQYLLTKHLLDTGYIELTLPDGMVLELGIVQEDRYGDLAKVDDYSWLIATQKNRVVSMDSYNLGLRYADNDDKLLFEDHVEDDGEKIKIFDVI